MTFIANAAHLAADASGALSPGKLRAAFRRLFASDWTERWMIVVNDHAAGTLTRDAAGVKVAWFDHAENSVAEILPRADASLAALHQEIALRFGVSPHRVVFLPIGE